MTWRETSLGALCVAGGGDIQTGPFGSQLHASDYVSVGIPVVMPTNIADNVVDPTGIMCAAEVHAERLSRHRLQADDIVYARRGDVEKRALVRSENEGWLCGTGCLRIRFGKDPVCDPTFVSYLLGAKQQRAWILRHAVGATMLNLNTSILAALPLTVPKLDEQRRIGRLLTAFDAKLASDRRTVDLAERLGEALVASVDAPVALGAVVDTSREVLHSGEWESVHFWHYSLPAFDRGQVPTWDASAGIKSDKLAVDGPMVLVSKLNPRFPRVWDIPRLREGRSIASTEFVALRPTVCSSSVLRAVLMQPAFRFALEGKVSGTSGSHQRVRPDDLLATQVIDPRAIPASTQDRVETLGRLVDQLRIEAGQLVLTRDLLLEQLMSGRLRVKDAEKQVEDVL